MATKAIQLRLSKEEIELTIKALDKLYEDIGIDFFKENPYSLTAKLETALSKGTKDE